MPHARPLALEVSFITWTNTNQYPTEVKAVRLPHLKSFQLFCFICEIEVQPWPFAKTSVCCLLRSSQSPGFYRQWSPGWSIQLKLKDPTEKKGTAAPRLHTRLILPYSWLTVPTKEFWTSPLSLPVHPFPVFLSTPTEMVVWLFFF